MKKRKSKFDIREKFLSQPEVNGIKEGLEHIKAGRTLSHTNVISMIDKKLNRKTIIDIVNELPKADIPADADLKKLYYERWK